MWVYDVGLLSQSYLAFSAVDMYDQDRIERVVNGEIVSESESDNPEVYTTVLTLSACLEEI